MLNRRGLLGGAIVALVGFLGFGRKAEAMGVPHYDPNIVTRWTNSNGEWVKIKGAYVVKMNEGHAAIKEAGLVPNEVNVPDTHYCEIDHDSRNGTSLHYVKRSDIDTKGVPIKFDN